MLGDVLRQLVMLLAHPVLPTVSVAEIIWVAPGLIALRSNFDGWRWRYKVRREALRRSALLDPRQVVIAFQRHSAEAFAFGIQVALSLLGLVAALTPEPPPREYTTEQAAIVLTFDLVLLGMQLALAIGSRRQRGYDRKLRALPSTARGATSETGNT